MVWIAPGADAQDQEIPDRAREALGHVMMAYLCPTNDDAISIALAQASMDEVGFSEVTAQEAFDLLVNEGSPTSPVSEGLGCSSIEQIEQDHPFK